MAYIYFKYIYAYIYSSDPRKKFVVYSVEDRRPNFLNKRFSKVRPHFRLCSPGTGGPSHYQIAGTGLGGGHLTGARGGTDGKNIFLALGSFMPSDPLATH